MMLVCRQQLRRCEPESEPVKNVSGWETANAIIMFGTYIPF